MKRSPEEHHYWSKLSGARGTVMLEFALLMSLLLMMGTFVIEMLQFHDAQLMADHTAWRLARIAQVRLTDAKEQKDKKGKQKDKKDKKDDKADTLAPDMPKVMGLKAEKTVTVFLMCTATPGWGRLFYHEWQDKITGWELDAKLGGIGDGITQGLLKATGLFDKMFNGINSLLKNQRILLHMAHAVPRVLKKDVIEIKTESVGKLELPHISTGKDKEPGEVEAHAVKVSLDYPMRGGWLFKYFGSDQRDTSDPRAHGRAVMLAENHIKDISMYIVDRKKSPGFFSVVGTLCRKAFKYRPKKVKEQKLTQKEKEESIKFMQSQLKQLQDNNQQNFAREEALKKSQQKLLDQQNNVQKLVKQEQELSELEQNRLPQLQQQQRLLELKYQQQYPGSTEEAKQQLQQDPDYRKVADQLKSTNRRIAELQKVDFAAARQESQRLDAELRQVAPELQALTAKNDRARQDIAKIEKSIKALRKK